jgi:LmbE family N-acetylglucosaminyl deacetylase
MTEPWNRDADTFVPDGSPFVEALARTTHLAVGAHQDDIEFMALHGVLACFGRDELWFTGVTITNGGGSPRSGPYAGFTDEAMRRVRVAEQRTAAMIGGYSCQLQLAYPSAAVKDAARTEVVADLEAILRAARPEVVYLHNPADKHDTHVACCLRAIAALRRLPAEQRPAAVYGCEVWRGLDWLPDADKLILPADGRDNLAAALSGVFDSQIVGGKRYDLAVQGRRLANATFLESHAVDRHSAVSYAIDLTPLVIDPELEVRASVLELVRRLGDDISDRILRMSGR